MSQDKLWRLLDGVLDYDQTPEEARAELEADGVNVDAFLDRVHDDTSRFFIEHGVIHDRQTGRHLTLELEPDYPKPLLSLLRQFEEQLAAASLAIAAKAEALREAERALSEFAECCGNCNGMGIYEDAPCPDCREVRAALSAVRGVGAGGGK